MEAIDTSVLILRQRNADAARWFEPRLRAGTIAVCDLVVLEYLMGARNGSEYDSALDALDACERLAVEPGDMRRAIEVQQALAHQTSGGQRAVTIPDLIIAAAAERAGLPLVHYDEDFDRIAAITGQATTWIVARGSASVG
jgi:predicted nucleic acid-binding protein